MSRKAWKTVFPLVLAALVLALPLSAVAKDYLYVPATNHLQVIDCEKDVIIKTVPYIGSTISCMASPDGKRFYMNAQRRLFVVDTAKDEIVDTYDFWSDLNRVKVAPAIGISQDGGTLYMACDIVKKKLNIPRLNVLPPQLIVYDVKTRKMTKSYEIPPMCYGVITLRNDPNKLYLFGQDVCTLDLKSGKVETVKGILHPEPDSPQLNSLVNWNNGSPGDHGLFTNPAYSADFTKLFYIIIDTNTGKLSVLQGEEAVMGYSTTVSPDKKYIYIVMDEVYKVDFQTGKTVAMDPVPAGTNYCLAITSDGKKLYLGGAGAVSVYDTETMKLKSEVRLDGDTLSMTRITK